MTKQELLLRRLDDIGRLLANSGRGLALIGLGSVGIETDRIDEFSDLDFFAIVEGGCKQRYLQNLDWLNSIVPLVFHFRNTADGYKALFNDNVYCEFAVFEPDELSRISFAPGRIVWKRDDVDGSVARPAKTLPILERTGIDWQLGEALTNLYVGMCRFCRGEKLAAARLVQQCAVDRVLEMVELKGSTSNIHQDPFSLERRLEQRHVEIAALLPGFIQGYEHTPESSEAILDYLGQEHSVNPAMAEEIRRLCALARDRSGARRAGRVMGKNGGRGGKERPC